jgi:hypothetical protein
MDHNQLVPLNQFHHYLANNFGHKRYFEATNFIE